MIKSETCKTVPRPRIPEELAMLLQDPNRDFDEEPITDREAHALLLTLIDLVSNEELSGDMVEFYEECLTVVKSNIVVH
jgi:hypothetical protein